jgi:hypothetical protein
MPVQGKGRERVGRHEQVLDRQGLEDVAWTRNIGYRVGFAHKKHMGRLAWSDH